MIASNGKTRKTIKNKNKITVDKENMNETENTTIIHLKKEKKAAKSERKKKKTINIAQ